MGVELTNKIVKCRKAHKCQWCGEETNIGDQANYRAAVHKGEFFSGHMHTECYAAMINSNYDDFDEGEFNPMEQKRGKTMGESHD